MNSDPYDSAAWRSFGMLDADESAIFDEAMRHDPLLRSASQDMDRLSAAVAVAIAPPVVPRPGQLERLQSRLGLNPSRRAYLWLGISGWAAAAVLALLLVLNTRRPPSSAKPAIANETATTGTPSQAVVARPNDSAVSQDVRPLPPSPNAIPVPTPHTSEADTQKLVRVETRRLTQEIEVLRDNLEKFQQRDRILFEAVPGIALPVIMKMSPPNSDSAIDPALAANDPVSPVFHLLAENLRSGKPETPAGNPDHQVAASANVALNEEAMASETPAAPQLPSAIPIYDPARDEGVLQVSNLSPAPEGMTHHLWVKTANSAQPIHVGSMSVSAGVPSESFDFSLGSNMVLPSAFILTVGALNAPAAPASDNTVLEGPPTPSR